MAKTARRVPTDLRRQIYMTLEQGPRGNWKSSIVARTLLALIVINLTAVVLESMPQFETRFATWFWAIELISLIVFTVEYALRLWVAPEHTPYKHLPPLRARLRYVLSAGGIVDLLAVLPFWFAFALPGELRVILVLRIVRILKVARYSAAMRSLLEVINAERRALFGCIVILFCTTLVSGSLMHLLEGKVQPEKLGTIPDAMWWAIVTLGTIGYGDVVPLTAPGKLLASATIFLGLVMVALPVGIIATGFAEEIHRRDFVVTWGMVARVPLFAELQASDIADVMRLLRAQQFEVGEIIARRGEPAHSMYLVAAGEVEIELERERVRLGVGHFFGEIAVLRRARRSATITAVRRTSLLVLDAQDLHRLMQREPRIANHVREVTRNRLGRELVTKSGDIITEEIEESS